MSQQWRSEVCTTSPTLTTTPAPLNRLQQLRPPGGVRPLQLERLAGLQRDAAALLTLLTVEALRLLQKRAQNSVNSCTDRLGRLAMLNQRYSSLKLPQSVSKIQGRMPNCTDRQTEIHRCALVSRQMPGSMQGHAASGSTSKHLFE